MIGESLAKLRKTNLTQFVLWLTISVLVFFGLFIPTWTWFENEREEGLLGGALFMMPFIGVFAALSSVLALGILTAGRVIYRLEIRPRLTRSLGPNASFVQAVDPRRLWAIRRFRRWTYTLAILVSLTAVLAMFFRIRSPRDVHAYAGMMSECHPVWREFAFRKFGPGDAAQDLFRLFPPTRSEEFGRYGIHLYHKDSVGIPFTGLHVITRDGRLLGAGAASCTWGYSFFWEDDPELDQAYSSYLSQKYPDIYSESEEAAQ